MTKTRAKKLRLGSLVFAVTFFAFPIFCLGMFLTPSQKHELVEAERRVEHELVEAEHRVEDWLHNRENPGPQLENTYSSKESDKNSPDESASGGDEQEIPMEEAAKEQQHDPHENDNPEAEPTSWVEREKALKRKLRVLYDQQAKGENLGVPVLTRYLGEDIPAYVGTPDSTMKEEEWKLLVEAKYKEMRQEEEEWQKKMALLIEKRERDIGITTP